MAENTTTATSSTAPAATTDTAAAGAKPVVIPQGSVIITDLPADMPKIYTRVIRHFFPTSSRTHPRKGGRAGGAAPRKETHFISEATVIEEADNATIAVEVPSKEAAQRVFRRLQNAKVCGRRWKVFYAPAKQAQPSPDPCLVECLLVPAGSRDLAERALAVVPGFLAFAELPPEMTNHKEAGEQGHDGSSGEKFLASFADEGCALHARAVLSGRLIGTSGVRMFLERRR